MRISDLVQTCALPIFVGSGPPDRRTKRRIRFLYGLLTTIPCSSHRIIDKGNRIKVKKAGRRIGDCAGAFIVDSPKKAAQGRGQRSEEHTSELQSLMRISYAVFCLKKKKTIIVTTLLSIHISQTFKDQTYEIRTSLHKPSASIKHNYKNT